MKLLTTLILMIIITSVMTITVVADYPNFESITIIDGHRLEAFTSDEYSIYYKEVKRRKMFGWRIHYVHDRIDITYIKETLFSFYNDGYTAIEYDYQMEYESSSTFQIQATGTIAYTTKDDGRSFKNKLDASLKISTDYKTSTSKKESVDIHIKVDPGTQVDLYIYGEGYITNGVAARYFFWFRRNLGGFEWFEKTTEYQRLEKIKV
mgnify:FL=1